MAKRQKGEEEMKCPKCKKEMEKGEKGNLFYKGSFLVCLNKKCEYYGIVRNTFQ